MYTGSSLVSYNFISDIYKSSDKLKFFLLADDTTLLLANKVLKVLGSVNSSDSSKVSE